MAFSTCQSCSKSQPFVERMMYCSFCGTHYTESEMFNALQRSRQDRVVFKWSLGYWIGGFLTVFFILPLLMLKFVPDLQTRASIGNLAVMAWLFLSMTRPFAREHAKKLHPEKSA